MMNHLVTLIVILFFFTKCGADSGCCEKVSLHYLETAVDMIGKAKQYFSIHNFSRNALDCSELFERGYKKNGVYTVWPQSRVLDGKPLEVYCDMETNGGGWTVIQRRGSFGRAQDYFYKDWESYKKGFGDIDKDFWLGNDNIFALTNQKLYSARFDLVSPNNGTMYAHYDTFWIGNEYSKYTLHIADYRGDAGDAMGVHHNKKFSAKDEDNDISKSHCAEKYKGGWWYSKCYGCNINGLYLNGSSEDTGLRWDVLTGDRETLLSTEIKIRPRYFKLPHDTINNTHM